MVQFPFSNMSRTEADMSGNDQSSSSAAHASSLQPIAVLRYHLSLLLLLIERLTVLL